MSIWQAYVSPIEGVDRPEWLPASGCPAEELLRQKTERWSSMEALFVDLFQLERQGVVALQMPVADETLGELRTLLHQLDALYAANPSLHNLAGDIRAWADDSDHYDVVEQPTDLGALKDAQRQLYLEQTGHILDSLPDNASILDVGCGSGRFIQELAPRAGELVLVDASPEALKRATERALAAQATSHFTLDAFVSTTEEMALLEPRRFDLIWAIEVICYTAEPVETMKRLLQLLKPGGVLVMSVEGRIGSALGDPRLDPTEAKAALVSGRRTRQGDVAVSYFTRQELTDAMSVAGFEAIEVQGSHYVLEGPCAHLLEGTVEGKERTAAALGLERLCRQHPHLSDLARAWIGIGTRGR